MNIGVNFFGPKRRLYQDLVGTLDALKAGGISSAEICVAFAGNGEPPKELNLQIPPEVIRQMSGGIWPLETAPQRLAAVRERGLTVVSCHMMLGFETSPEQLVGLIPLLLDFARDNALHYYVFSPMKDAAGIAALIPAIRQVSEALAREGVMLLLHNHEMECAVQNGTTALELVMEQCPALGLELDVGWARYAGADPVAIMRKYGERIPLLHFKDVTADACPEIRDTCFTAIGEGSIPLREIMAAVPCCALAEHGLIIDQDDSPGDIVEDLIRGAGNIRAAAR